MKRTTLICLLLLPLLLTSCFKSGRSAGNNLNAQDSVITAAKLLSMQRTADYTVVTVGDPWKGGVLHRYVLVPRDSVLPDNLPDGTVVRTPVQRALVYSSVHTSLMAELWALEALRGVVDKQYFIDPFVTEGVASGKIADCGNSMNPTVERVIDMQPDAILLSPYQDASYGQIASLDIPIIECADYLEYDPLGRAEWVKFYGELFGKRQEADSLFDAIDKNYNTLKALAKNNSQKVLLDKITGSVWYVPGGKSTIGQMIQDAGGNNPWAGDEHSGSVSLPFEAVLEKAGEADIWLFRYSSDHDITYDELRTEHHGYNQFKAFRNQQVYGCNVELSPFYEETPFHPDWLLNDFIRILHPELDSLAPLRYYKKL